MFGKSVLNANFSTDQYLNLMKGFSFQFSGTMTPANLNADQYPSGTIPNTYAGNSGSFGIDPTYYGHYILKWTGVSNIQTLGGVPVIIYDGGTFAGLGGNTGTRQFTLPVDATSPSVEFAAGALITAVSTLGGLVQFSTTANFWGNIVTGSKVQITHVTGLPAGPNSDGSWTTTQIDAQTFTLQGSSAYAGLVSINTSGTVGVNTEALISQSQFTVTFQTGVTHSISNLILCFPSSLTAINSGQQLTAAAIAAVQAIRPRYVRFMDVLATQSLNANYAGKAPSTSMTWGDARWDPTYNGGTTTATTDAYSCSNPSASPSTGVPVDGETVQVTFNRTNTTTKPTLAISRTSFGSAVPIVNSDMKSLNLTLTGSRTTGDILTYVFSNSNFSGGTHTFNYTVLVGDSSIDILGASVGAAMVADLAFAQIGIFFSYGGNGNLVATCATPTTATFSASGSSTEICSPGTFTAAGSFVSGASATFIYSAVLQAWVFQSGGAPYGVPLEYAYEMCTRANVGAWFCLNVIYTSASTSSLGAAAATNLPGLPVICEYSNEIWNFGAAPTGQAIALGTCMGFGAASAGYMDFYGLRTAQLLPVFASGYTGAGGTRSNLELITADVSVEGAGGYTGNMVSLRWNGGCLAPSPVVASGSISGTTLSIIADPIARCGMQVTGAGVTAGTVITKVFGNGTFTVNNSQTVGPVTITLTNPLYSALSGPGGTSSSTAYNAFPTRPIDLSDGTSYATYVEGAQAGNGSGSWTGTQSFYNTMFQASKDYASGVPASMTSAITAWSNDIRDGTVNGIRNSNGMSSFLGTTNAASGSSFIPGWETKVAVYDGARPSGKSNLSVRCYEGHIPQQPMVANIVGGFGGIQSTDLTNQFNANGWTLSPTFGASNAVVAANMVTLALAYRNDAQYATDQLYFWNQQKSVHATRNFSPAQYGFVNGLSGTWALYPGLLNTTPWQAFAGQAAYNRQ